MKLFCLLFFPLISYSMEGFDYSINSIDKASFEVKITKDLSRKDEKVCPKSHLLSIASAEECEKRNYKYVDIGVNNEDSAFSTCFSNDSRKSLGITFFDKVQGLIVESLNEKKPTELMLNDKITLMDSLAVASVSDVKKALSKYSNNTENIVNLTILRNKKIIVIKEPLIVRPNANIPLSEIWAARSTCRDNILKK